MPNMSNADYFAKNLEDVESEEIFTLHLGENFNTLSKKRKIVYNEPDYSEVFSLQNICSNTYNISSMLSKYVEGVLKNLCMK